MSSTGTFRRGGGASTFAAADLLGRLTAGMSHQERLSQVQFLARIMDEQFIIPGTGIRFGWDSILGLFPGVGDAITSAISLLIVHHARQTGASRIVIARMLANYWRGFPDWCRSPGRRCLRLRLEGESQECPAA